MAFSLKSFNIVIFAKNHNPTIISKEWLTDKQILKEKVNNFAHTPVFSVIETEDYDLIVDPERLYLSGKKANDKNIKRLIEIAKKYAETLPEIPYKGLELRYVYEIESDEKHLKELFVKNDKLFKSLFGEKYQISGTIKSDYKGFISNSKFLKFKDKIIGDICYNLKLETNENINKGLKQHPELIKKSQEIIGEMF
ncbi:MAG: hypothetical protein ACTSV5_11055 [Promethearchaeota archaeon]